MSTQRLNGYIRDAITKAVMSKTNFQQNIDKLKEQYFTAEEVYEAFYTKAVRDKMYALPEGWLEEHESCYVSFGGQRLYMYFEKNDSGKRQSKRFLNKDNGSMVFPVDHKLTVKFTKNFQEKQKLEEELYRFQCKVEATLRSVTTVPKLLTVWPELKDIVPPELFYYDSPQLPAIITEDLNKHINFKKSA